MALTLKQLKMTPKRTELLEKMGLTDSDAILMCVPLRYQSREVIPYDQWQAVSYTHLDVYKRQVSGLLVNRRVS